MVSAYQQYIENLHLVINMITKADHTPNFDSYNFFAIISPAPSMTIPTVPTVARNEMRKLWET